ncbi:MAG: ABC transporter permease [Alicyclobacillus sp.]|nr:ABC transporter permease [Alicyclobacillus sp.]
MRRYLVRRIGVSLLVLYLVITITFFLVRLMPGDPATYMYMQLINSHTMTPEQALQQVSSLYGVQLHQPLIQQYFQYLWNFIRGNFGQSIDYSGKSVLSIIANALPWTLLSVSISLLISFFLGVLIGTLMAYLQKTKLSAVIAAIMTLLNAVPNYLIALFLLYYLADLHNIFPNGGAYGGMTVPGWNVPFLLSVANHLILPTAAYVITATGSWALRVNSSVIGTLGEEYIAAARARGLLNRRIVGSYVARNAMLPVVTSLGITMGFMIGGSAFIETMFTYPGIGDYLGLSVAGRDYPLMMGCFILISLAVVVANIVTDLINMRLDPRAALSIRQ